MKKRLSVDPVAISGEYNRQGYSIFEVFSDGTSAQIYHGGNCCEDSTVTVDLDDVNCVRLRKIRSYCVKMARRHAERRSLLNVGVTRIDDDEEYERMVQEIRKGWAQ